MDLHTFATIAGGVFLGGLILAAVFSPIGTVRPDDPRARYSVYRARTRREQYEYWRELERRNLEGADQ